MNKITKICLNDCCYGYNIYNRGEQYVLTEISVEGHYWCEKYKNIIGFIDYDFTNVKEWREIQLNKILI